jgi:hypothetical protein
MDDFGRQFPYPRYLKVPFIFLADGEPEPPEWAQFKRDYPGWVIFRGSFTPSPPEPEPEQQHVPNTEPMTEAEAEAAYWAHHDAQSAHAGEAQPPPWPNSNTVPSVLLNPMGNADARLGRGPARIKGTELWTSEGLSAAMHASAAHIAAHHGDVDVALVAAKAAGLNGTGANQPVSAAIEAVSIPVSYAVSPRLQTSEPIVQTASPDTHGIDALPGPVQLAADDGTPGNNQAQNKQFRAVARLLRLNKDQQRLLHEEISGQNYGYQEILNAARDMIGE